MTNPAPDTPPAPEQPTNLLNWKVKQPTPSPAATAGPTKESNAELGFRLTRRFYGYFNGDGSGTHSALVYFDTTGKHLPGPASLIEWVGEQISAHVNAQLAAMREQRGIEMAAVMTASIENTEASVKNRIDRTNPYWTVCYEDVCRAVDREIKHRNRADKAEAQLAAKDARIAELEKERGSQKRRDSFDLQAINRIVADQTKNLQADLAAAQAVASEMATDAESYHKMCDRLWMIVKPRDGLPCDVIFADKLAATEQQLAAERELADGLAETLVSAPSPICEDAPNQPYDSPHIVKNFAAVDRWWVVDCAMAIKEHRAARTAPRTPATPADGAGKGAT